VHRFSQIFRDLLEVFRDIPRLARGFTDISRLCIRGFFGLCTPYSSVHSHILVCTLVFLDCAQVFPDIPEYLLEVFRDISRLVRGFSGLCTPYSSVHSHIQVCTLVFLDCAQVFPDISRLVEGFQIFNLLEVFRDISRLVRGFFGLCTPYSSVHSHILVCTLVFLDCAQVFPDIPRLVAEVFRDIPRLVRGFQIFRDLCRGFFWTVHTVFMHV